MTAPDRFMYGAVDLSQVKASAEERDTPAGQIPALTEVTAANLESAVLRRSTHVPVVVLVGTARSPESEQLKADLEALATESRRGFLVGYVDADRAPEVAQVFGVQALPTVVAVAAGRPVTSFEGGQPLEALRQWTDALVAQVGGQLAGLDEEPGDAEAAEAAGGTENPEEPSELDYAIALAARGQVEQAEQLFAALAPQEPRAAAYLDLLARLREEPEEPLRAADEAMLAGRSEEAFDHLLGLLPTERRDAARTRLLELFRLREAADPEVAAARTRLASALF
ncbi:tetratricopeptide repeat protein [Corynebacterium mastitidis]|uniref:tetratricopeptide repeat protein n=1 Tax=Corynebacterium mastitidis TaxID=161890 RepID=UPI00254FC460|nr:tetratricopeptide repeat protein [Corynebacterium mastitidis]MDK8451253.1 tetratricopeptide repeat protein [Corynebacterium mastitidis]